MGLSTQALLKKHDQSPSVLMQQTFSKMLNQSNWFHRFTRFIFGLNKAIDDHRSSISQSSSNKIGVVAALTSAANELTNVVSKRYNAISRWLMGFDTLVKNYNAVLIRVRSWRAQLVKENNKFAPPDRNKLGVDSYKKINDYLIQRQRFIETTEIKQQPQTLPFSLSTFGITNQITPHLLVSGGKPATYGNMKREYKENIKAMEETREEAPERSIIIPPPILPFTAEAWAWPSQVIDNTPAWQRWSDKIDSYDSTAGYMRRGIERLSLFAPRVKINERGQPQVVYPSPSSR